MKRLVPAILLASAASPAFAALSPYWDSAAKIQAVVHSAAEDKLRAGPITGVEQIDDLTYVIHSGECSAKVTLEAHAAKVMVGPTSYTVKEVTQEAECN